MNHNLCAAALSLCLALPIFGSQRGAINNVPEATNYALVYSLNIPNNPNYSGGINYDLDFRSYIWDYTRVAYYLELQTNGGPLNYIWVSMDPFTWVVDQIGVPTASVGVLFQQPVTGMNVASSVAGIVTGTNLNGGNIEFCSGNYSQGNSVGVPNASDATYDWGDTLNFGVGYGSMQIANALASQELFCFNGWNGSGNDLGIGSNPDPNGQPDWTFANNLSSYTVKTLQVFVLPTTTQPPVLDKASGVMGLTNVVLYFTTPLENAATNISHYALSGGVQVLSATLDPANRLAVTLTTTAQKPLTTYTATVNGVRDSTSAHLTVAANSQATFQSPSSGRGATNNVAEATNYTLVYSLDIPDSANYSGGVTYNTDLRANVSGFSRIAYYMELQKSGGFLDFCWVSMDVFTNDIGAIGVPTVASGAVFQQYVTNMNVFSSVAGIITGTKMDGGNIEFTPSNYDRPNALGVQNASDALFDWGDIFTSGNYGSMQIANTAAPQELICFNHWGGAGGASEVGIGSNPDPNGQPDWTFSNDGPSYTIKTLQVYVIPINDTNRPVIVSSTGGNLNQAVLTFNKGLDDSATNAAHYTLSGGLTVLSAVLDPITKATVVLATTAQQPNTTYTVTVNGVYDRTALQTPIEPNTKVTFTSSPLRGATVNVPEATNYALVYSLDIPHGPDFTGGVLYNIDLHNYISDFTRIGYYVELETSTGPLQYLWVSMDAFTTDITQIGVPTFSALAGLTNLTGYAGGEFFQQPVTGMNVASSVAGIVTGTNLDGGNIEFWPYNYDGANAMNVPNATGAFDWGDTVQNGGNYGSMQIANSLASQELFCFNGWNGNVGDLGIGNNPVGQPDWTFANNVPSYTVKTLQVFVLPTSNTKPVLAAASGALGLTNVVLTFSKALEDDATNVSHYALDGGLSVLGATLDPKNRVIITLTTTPQQSLKNYTLTVNGVRDATASHLAVDTNTTATFQASAVRGAVNNVPEAANYTLVYSLDVPIAANYYSNITYNIDQSAAVSTFSRIAYYVELEKSGQPLTYLWASMDAFTNNAAAIGVPTRASGAVFQQPVSGMNVASSVAGIVTGTNLMGNLEFWPYNYTQANATNVPNASDTLYDWGDTIDRGGSHGSMQLANAAASQELFCFNNWGGNGGDVAIGIGNNPIGNPDWTFAANASSYAIKTIQVYVLSNQKPFKITGQSLTAGQFAVTCQTQTGGVYSLWRCLDLTTANWTKVAETTATGSSSTLVDAQAPSRASFYQVRTP